MLEKHGLSPAALERGWDALRRAATLRHATATVPGERVDTARPLAAWGSKWIAVADSTARHNAPKLHARVMRGLHRASDAKDFGLVVDGFLDRLDALAADRTAPAKALAALLAERGLTPAVRAEGRALVAATVAFGPVGPAPDPRLPQRQREAFEAAAAFYREWSAISRAVIHDKRLLAALGFGKAGRPKGSRNAPKAAEAERRA